METLSEAKRGRFSRYPGAPLTGNFETESRSGMEAARCIPVTDSTDWQFPDELKRKLKR
jgi:hypothetical protein